MKRPSPDLRERLVAAGAAGLSPAEAATWFGVSERTVTRWHRLRRETGTLASRRPSGRPPKMAPTTYPALADQVAARPDATLAEHCAVWAAAHGVVVSPATMARLLAKLGFSLKKRP